MDIRSMETIVEIIYVRPTRWLSPRTITMICTACSSRLGEVLLRDQMFPILVYSLHNMITSIVCLGKNRKKCLIHV